MIFKEVLLWQFSVIYVTHDSLFRWMKSVWLTTSLLWVWPEIFACNLIKEMCHFPIWNSFQWNNLSPLQNLCHAMSTADEPGTVPFRKMYPFCPFNSVGAEHTFSWKVLLFLSMLVHLLIIKQTNEKFIKPDPIWIRWMKSVWLTTSLLWVWSEIFACNLIKEMSVIFRFEILFNEIICLHCRIYVMQCRLQTSLVLFLSMLVHLLIIKQINEKFIKPDPIWIRWMKSVWLTTSLLWVWPEIFACNLIKEMSVIFRLEILFNEIICLHCRIYVNVHIVKILGRGPIRLCFLSVVKRFSHMINK
jgi:hypothetical protein